MLAKALDFHLANLANPSPVLPQCAAVMQVTIGQVSTDSPPLQLLVLGVQLTSLQLTKKTGTFGNRELRSVSSLHSRTVATCPTSASFPGLGRVESSSWVVVVVHMFSTGPIKVVTAEEVVMVGN